MAGSAAGEEMAVAGLAAVAAEAAEAAGAQRTTASTARISTAWSLRPRLLHWPSLMPVPAAPWRARGGSCWLGTLCAPIPLLSARCCDKHAATRPQRRWTWRGCATTHQTGVVVRKRAPRTLLESLTQQDALGTSGVACPLDSPGPKVRG